MAKLTVTDLHLNYGVVPILKGVSIELRQGEVVALLGASGSGKTTLLRAIAGLETPQSGTIALDGRPVFDAAFATDVAAQDRNLGVVFQSYALWPHRTVFDNVAYGLRLRKTPAAEIETRVLRSLEQLGLAHLRERFPHQLSGGQQQRVAIARALVYNPPVLLLDEPLSNLDAKLREEAKAWLRSLIVDLQLSAVLVTHDQGEAMAVADHIVLLAGGKVEQSGSPVDIYQKPATLFAAQFVGANNTLTGTLAEDGRTILGDGWSLKGNLQQPAPPGSLVSGVIRVEQLRLLAAPGENNFPVKPVTTMYLGERWQHVVRLGNDLVRVYSNTAEIAPDVWLEVPSEHLWIFPAAAEALSSPH